MYRVSGGWRTVLLGLCSPDICLQFPCRAKKMDTSLGAVSIKVLFPEDILSPGSAGLRGLLSRGSESREPVPGKRGSRGAMKPWEGAKWRSDRPMDSGGGPTVLIWCSFVHGISCLVTGVSVHWCIWGIHNLDIQAPPQYPRVEIGDSESEAAGAVGKAGKAGKAGKTGKTGKTGKRETARGSSRDWGISRAA